MRIGSGGIEANIWKIAGLDEPNDCRHVAEQARQGGRDHVTRIVLGGGANTARVNP